MDLWRGRRILHLHFPIFIFTFFWKVNLFWYINPFSYYSFKKKVLTLNYINISDLFLYISNLSYENTFLFDFKLLSCLKLKMKRKLNFYIYGFYSSRIRQNHTILSIPNSFQTCSYYRPKIHIQMVYIMDKNYQNSWQFNSHWLDFFFFIFLII